jgi:phosphocarrier protein
MSEQRRSFLITNALGVHTRAAAAFVQTANRFRADIEVEKDGRRMNGKSLLGLLLLAATRNAEVTIIARGDDAEPALEALGRLIQAKFGLEE